MTIAKAGVLIVAHISTGAWAEELSTTRRIMADEVLAQPDLGYGFNSKTNSVTDSCLERGSITYHGASTGTGGLRREQSMSTLSESLGLSARAKLRIGISTSSMKLDFARAAESSELSDTIVFKTEIIGKNAATFAKLTPTASQALNANARQFMDLCGDGFVAQIERHASLYILMRVDYASRVEKQRMSAHLSFDSPTVDVMGKVGTELASLGTRTSVYMEMLEVGGKTGKVARVGGNPRIVECRANQFGQCQDWFREVLAYSKEFSEDIGDGKHNSDEPNGLSAKAYIVQPWSVRNITLSSDPETTWSDRTRSELLARSDGLGRYRSIVMSLSKFANRMAESKLATLARLKKDIDSADDMLRAVAATCYNDTAQKCNDSWSRRKGEMEALDASMSTAYNEIKDGVRVDSFAQACDAVTSSSYVSGLSDIERSDVGKIVRKFQTKVPNSADPCGDLGKWLLEQSELNLNHLQLGNVGALLKWVSGPKLAKIHVEGNSGCIPQKWSTGLSVVGGVPCR